MWKGKTLTRMTAGLIMVAATAACGGGDAPEGGDTAAPATQPSASTPGTAAPGGDPTAAPTTGTATDGAAAPAAGGAAAAGGDNAALVAQGQQLYQGSICVSCHGAQGAGTPLAPALNDDEWLWVEEGEDLQTQIATIIKTGVSQPRDPAHVAPMLPYGGAGQMPDDQVDAMAAYIVSISQGG